MSNEKLSQVKTSIANFAVGSIVQVPLHDVDITRADGNNLSLVVVEFVQKKDNNYHIYHLACF